MHLNEIQITRKKESHVKRNCYKFAKMLSPEFSIPLNSWVEILPKFEMYQGPRWGFKTVGADFWM